MRPVTHLVTWAALLLALMASAAVAQDNSSPDIRSAKAMLPHCMTGLKPDGQDMAGGRCAGIIATLSFVSRVLPDNLKFCHPSGTTPEQMLQVIEGFTEANPDAGAQDFRLVALAAMRQKWPCQEYQLNWGQSPFPQILFQLRRHSKIVSDPN